MPDLYVSLKTLRQEPWNITEAEATDERLASLIVLSKRTVDLACMQRFDDHDRTIIGRGTGSGLFQTMLHDQPPYGRLRAVTTLKIDGEPQTLSNFVVRPWSITWKAIDTAARASRLLTEGIFPQDAEIEVLAACGFEADTIPAPILDLQAMVIVREVRPHLKRGGAVASESFAGQSYSLRQLQGPSPFGDPDLDQIVQAFRPYGPLVAV